MYMVYALEPLLGHQGFIQDSILGGGGFIVHLLRIATEGPELSRVAFDKILDVFEEKSRCIDL